MEAQNKEEQSDAQSSPKCGARFGRTITVGLLSAEPVCVRNKHNSGEHFCAWGLGVPPYTWCLVKWNKKYLKLEYQEKLS